MEQWVLDGRDIIRDRGFSRIPGYVEEDGYAFDASGGLRGFLKRVVNKNCGSETTARVNVHSDPEGMSSSQINYAKGLPHLYAECEVDYEYRYNGRIVDSNREDLALADLADQIAKEEAELERTRKLREELERGVAPAIDDEQVTSVPASTGAVSAESGTAPEHDKASSPQPFVAADTPVSFPTPKTLPKIGSYFPLELILGAGQVTQAMDEAVLSMYEGEETEWWVDPAFAFRDHGLRTKFGSIPADAAVQMKVKLLRFVNPMSSYERIQYATCLKDEANIILQRALACEKEQQLNPKEEASGGAAEHSSASSVSLLQEAVLAYNRALTKLGKTFVYKKKSKNMREHEEQQQRAQAARGGEASVAENAKSIKKNTSLNPTNGSLCATHDEDCSETPEPTREAQVVLDSNLRAVILTNLSLCWFKRDDILRSSDYVDRALKANPSYAKAVYRKALIEERRCNFDEAIALLEGLLAPPESAGSQPSTGVVVSDVESKIKSLKETSALQDAAQRRTFGGMFRT